jgi:DnaJ-class molecular chaperone
MADKAVKRTCPRCLGTKFIQVKTKPGRTWTNVQCPRCQGSGKV